VPVFPPITTTYLLIFVPELPDDGRLCKGALVVLVGFPHILLVFEATLSGLRLQAAATSGATQTCPGVSDSLSKLLELGISTSEEDMVRGIKEVQDGKKSSIDGRFEKGLIMAGALGYIYTIFGLEASLAGLPGQAVQ
jgi:hypothetical protein